MTSTFIKIAPSKIEHALHVERPCHVMAWAYAVGEQLLFWGQVVGESEQLGGRGES